MIWEIRRFERFEDLRDSKIWEIRRFDDLMIWEIWWFERFEDLRDLMIWEIRRFEDLKVIKIRHSRHKLILLNNIQSVLDIIASLINVNQQQLILWQQLVDLKIWTYGKNLAQWIKTYLRSLKNLHFPGILLLKIKFCVPRVL